MILGNIEAQPADVGRRGDGGRLLGAYGRALPFALGGYLAFDRAFAYLHVPGTPLYVGEVLLAVGILGAAGTGLTRRVVAADPLAMLLLGFLAWGLVRTGPGLAHFGLIAIRDAALWYYGLFALLILVAAARDRELIPRLVSIFARFVPWLLVWLPLALVIPRIKNVPLRVPGSPINVFSHRPGNVAVAALVALAFLQLLPDDRRTPRARSAWSALALITIALAGTQSRGGFGAAGVAILFALAAGMVPRAGRLLAKVGVVAVLGLVIALTLSVSVSVQGHRAGMAGEGRALSAQQLVQNVSSVGGGKTSGNQGQTVKFRSELWGQIFHQQVQRERLVQGFGFGPNLAALAGIGKQAYNATLELRSPHNSHLDVLARMGLIGLGIWVLLWFSWFRRMLISRRRALQAGDHLRAGILAWCLVSCLAMLTAAGFDPTLEGAQIAALLWTLFGVGLALSQADRAPAAL